MFAVGCSNGPKSFSGAPECSLLQLPTEEVPYKVSSYGWFMFHIFYVPALLIIAVRIFSLFSSNEVVLVLIFPLAIIKLISCLKISCSIFFIIPEQFPAALEHVA